MMLAHEINDNGWTVHVDIDLKTCSQQDVNNIQDLLSTNVIVVFKNQFLTIDDELRLLHMFQNPTPLYEKDNPLFLDYTVDVDKDPNGIISRVTAELRNGKPGMAGDKNTFDWHVDSPEVPERNQLLYLRAVKGSQGSRTSWNNNLLAYHELDQHTKDSIAHLHCVYGNIEALWAPDYNGIYYNYEWTPSLVDDDRMYYVPYQLQKFVELSYEESQAINKKLIAHIFQDKYVYHHDWQDGDLIIADQWNGLHKRWAFDMMDIRVMHRATMDYTK